MANVIISEEEYNELKVYADENGTMYKEVQEWREKCIARDIDVDHLLSENKEKEKKYRDEISKLQNIVTEKDVEIKDLKRGIMILTYDRETINSIRNKNIKLNRTISDQEITIKALLLTIKEMCKEDETNE